LWKIRSKSNLSNNKENNWNSWKYSYTASLEKLLIFIKAKPNGHNKKINREKIAFKIRVTTAHRKLAL
jgi:hypothetical protein